MLFLKIFRSWRGRRRWKQASAYHKDPFVKAMTYNNGFWLGATMIPIVSQSMPKKTEGTYIYNDVRKILERLNLLEEL